MVLVMDAIREVVVDAVSLPLLLWIILILSPTATSDQYSSYSNELEDSSAEDNSTFRVFLGYSSDPWGPSSQLELASDQASSYRSSRKPKRSVVHLYNMVVCATGCNPLAYKGYGCYCGFLGSGYTMDPIDRCCKMHDWCYTTADCPMFLEYFVPYYWTCYRRRPLCALGSSCGQRLCECDRRLAECLSHYPCPHTKAVCTSSPWRLLQNLLML